MNQRIIYPTDDGGVAVIIPAPEWLAQEGNTMEALAAKNVPQIKRFVPSGVTRVDPDTGEEYEVQYEIAEPRPYRIINADDVPTDRTFRNAWEYQE